MLPSTHTLPAAPIARGWRDAWLGWTIDYAPAIGTDGISDALQDPSVRTIIVGSTGRIFRRIKHFSGYLIHMGEGFVPCDPAEGDPRCTWVDDDGFGSF